MSDPRYIPLIGGKYDGRRVFDHRLDICEDDGIKINGDQRYVVVATSSSNHVEAHAIPDNQRVQGSVWKYPLGELV